ncbi:DUF4282 domain-containing protein [Paraglaciecola sp. Hal342]
MKDLFFFDSMLTPKIITFVYWLMLLAAVASGVTTMFNAYSGGFISGLGILIAGVIGARIWCELLIVLFKIHENLKKIVDRNETSEL